MPWRRCAFLRRYVISRRDLFAFILTLGVLSLLFNYQVSNYDVSMVDQRLLTETSDVLYPASGLQTADDPDGASSVVFGRSLREHLSEVGPGISPRAPANLAETIRKVERWLLNGKRRALAYVESKNSEGGYSKSGYLSERLKQLQIEMVQKKDFRLWSQDDTVVQGNWTEIFCFGSNHCPKQTVSKIQKVDMIPSLQSFIDNPEETCNIVKLLEMGRGSQGPPCEPLHCDTFGTGSAIVTSRSQVVVNVSVAEICQRNATSSSSGAIVWYLPERPVVFIDGPMLRVHCLVTSFSPLRLYVHQKMFTAPYNALKSPSIFQKVTLDDILQYISETYGLGTSGGWWREIQQVMISYFAFAENRTNTSVARTDRTTGCDRCFQSAQIDIICNTVQKCRIIQVKFDPDYQGMFIEDVYKLITSKNSVSKDVELALSNALPAQSAEMCRDKTKAPGECLSEGTITYMLDWRREMKLKQDWIQVYPSNYGCHYLEQIPLRSPTKMINKLLMNFGNFFKWTEQTEPVSSESHNLTDGDGEEYPDTRVTVFDQQSEQTRPCSNDPVDFGKLATIHTTPKIDLQETSPRNYNGTVDYHTILVRMWAFAESCSCHIRLENKYNQPGAYNLTLGLGENKIMLYIVDSRSPNLDVVNAVTVTIHRKSREVVLNNASRNRLKTCSLIQECSLKFDSSASCGLAETSFPSQSRPHPRCTSGDHPGRWLIPCMNCDNENSCLWSEAVWKPYDCFYEKISPQALQKCLKGKKLLFVGDSTNRGIANYIIQQINGSLYDWDKTHTTRSYSNVNHGYTQFTFAYYPHFWLPADHRPKFSKVIYQLIKSSLPLENNSNTILVVGGVHWLSRQHIDLILEALQRKGLHGIKKVVKGLGAGFHQPVENVRFVPKSQQPYLQQREQDILNYAKTKDFDVVSTFNMTASRYQDFLEGKCACHFHKVTRHRIHGEEYRYSVEGDTNAAYSQMVLNKICS